MKAKIKRQHVYSVLFMRDDCGVTRFRLSGFWIKFLLLALLLLIAGAGFSGWGVHYYWKKYETVKAELRELENVLSENRRHLERLANLEKILESNDPARIRTAVSSVTGSDTPTDAAGGEGDTAAPGASAQGQAVETAEGGQTAGADDAGAAAGNGTDASGQPDGNQASPDQAVENQGSPAGGAAPPPDDHPVKLTNVSLRKSGNSRIQISFDLNNQDDPSQPLSGRVYLSVIDGDGNVTDILNADKNDLRFFQIQRYKTVRTTFALPTNVPLDAVREVQITVETEGNPVYVERLSMPQ